MVTIKDIALKSGVSSSTVSRVLNHDPLLNINPDTRAKILAVSEDLNYQTPRNRKSTTTLNTNYKVGLINWYTIEDEVQDTYYMSIRVSIERYCQENHIELYNVSKNDIDTKISKLDGIIAIGKFSTEEIAEIYGNNKSVVFVDFRVRNLGVDCVEIDFKESSRLILDHLIDSCGYKKIAFIGGREFVGDDLVEIENKRERYFRDIMNEKNLFIPEIVKSDTFTSLSGYNLTKEILEIDKPEAFFCASDAIALGAIRAIYDSGYKIPDDVAVVGFNDIPSAQFSIPPLTTLRVETNYMGQCAVDLIIEQIKGREYNKNVFIPTKLVCRETTKTKK